MPMEKPALDSSHHDEDDDDDEGGRSHQEHHYEQSNPSLQEMPDPSFSNNNNSSSYYCEPTGLRILCLHDVHSSASGLKSHLSLLGDRLYRKHGIDLVYINSPLCALAVGGETNRVWYETHKQKAANDTDDQEPQEPQQQQQQQEQEQQEQKEEELQLLLGLDASLCLLTQIWNSMPFWGILGIGQGAAVGSLLSLLPDVKPRAKFGIFIQGEALIQEDEQFIDSENDDWSCLHIIDPDETTVAGERLIQQFGGNVHHVSRSNGKDGYSKKVLNIIGKFIIEQKKKTRQDGECQVLALQNQLHFVEQEASRLIAQQIAENPPNILMAVVAPKEVAAGGMKRRGPDEEGGGAPCPPEFLLNRETRANLDTHTNGTATASRMHPKEQQQGNNNSNNPTTSDNDNSGQN